MFAYFDLFTRFGFVNFAHEFDFGAAILPFWKVWYGRICLERIVLLVWFDTFVCFGLFEVVFPFEVVFIMEVNFSI